jgi:hypothetical protein
MGVYSLREFSAFGFQLSAKEVRKAIEINSERGNPKK